MTSHRGMACLTAIVMVALCPAAGVRGQDAAYSAVPGTDFSKFKTYAWGDIPATAATDPAKAARIRRAVDAQLAAKRLTNTEGPADLLVFFEVTAQPERETFRSGSDMGVGNGSGVRFTSTTTPTEAIAVGLYDRKAKRLVWRGGATKPLHETRQRDVDAAVGKLFKYYPPRAN